MLDLPPIPCPWCLMTGATEIFIPDLEVRTLLRCDCPNGKIVGHPLPDYNRHYAETTDRIPLKKDDFRPGLLPMPEVIRNWRLRLCQAELFWVKATQGTDETKLRHIEDKLGRILSGVSEMP